MRSLQVGDSVLCTESGTSLQFVYAPIVTFIKVDPAINTRFLCIEMASGECVHMTENHVVFKQEGTTLTDTFAREVQPGDVLFVTAGSNAVPSVVRAVRAEMFAGVYAPLTATGTLIVDGVVTSCYCDYSHKLCHTSLAPLRWAGSLAVKTQSPWALRKMTPSGSHPIWWARFLEDNFSGRLAHMFE
jgi:hypothetical protein